MKRKLAIVVMLMVFVVGCAGSQLAKDPFLTASYQALSVMDSSYDLAWGSFVKLYKEGLVKEETFQAARKLAIAYFEDWTRAADYLKKYSQGTLPAEGFDAFKTMADVALKELKAYLAKQSGGVKPII